MRQGNSLERTTNSTENSKTNLSGSSRMKVIGIWLGVTSEDLLLCFMPGCPAHIQLQNLLLLPANIIASAACVKSGASALSKRRSSRWG